MITQSILFSHLTYNQSSGLFTWNHQRGRVKKGNVAGTVNSNGYIQIRINGRIYLAHRLAWLYVHGEFPFPMIDHINRNRQDNRIENLRLATKSQNSQNTLITTSNTSGYKGVSWSSKFKKWRASISINKKFKHLGFFEIKEDAYFAYQIASKQMHTHNIACKEQT